MTPRGRQFGLLIFLAALALRGGYVGWQWHRQGAALTFDDERLHWQLARHLVERGELVSDDGRRAARMPLYPLFLAGFAWMGTGGILAAKLAQAVLGAVTAWSAYRFARAALGPPAAALAGCLACCDPFAVFFANLLLTEVPFTLVGLGLTASAWKLTRTTRTHPADLPATAALGAAAVLLRPSALGWLPLLWLIVVLVGADRRRAVPVPLAGAVGLALALLPWGLRNRAVLGAWAWLGTNGGVTLYDAQGPQATGASDQAFLHAMPELAGRDEAARDRILYTLALEQMKSHPGRVLRLAAVKFRRTWSLLPNNPDYRRGPAALAGAGYTLLVLVLAGWGGWRMGRTNACPGGLAFHLLIWLPVVYFTLVHMVFVGSVRYRVPLMVFLALAAGVAAWKNDRPLPDRPVLSSAAPAE